MTRLTPTRRAWALAWLLVPVAVATAWTIPGSPAGWLFLAPLMTLIAHSIRQEQQ